MRTIASILLFFSFSECLAQITIDPALPKKYKNCRKNLPKELQKHLAIMDRDKEVSGVAVIIEFGTDTLNKAELKLADLSKITIKDAGPASNDTLKNKKSSNNETNPTFILLSGGHLSSDTLKIGIGHTFFDKSIRHIVTFNHVTTSYNEFYKQDSILKNNPYDRLTNNLIVPAQATFFSLNDSVFIPGKTIYGYAEVITNIYYQKDTWEEGQFLKIYRMMKYYFKFKLVKNIDE